MFIVTEKKIHILLSEAGVKRESGDYMEYERGKKVVAKWIWRNPDSLSDSVQRIIADYVGV